MSYGLKYILTWWSEKGNDCKIEVYKKGYAGASKLKKMGSAPTLVIDNADNGVMGTSLQFSIQADTDGELQELYTTDSKMYKVLLYRNDAVIWSGYLLQELYSEEYIAAPYDVSVTATDQLALLKDEPYKPLGRVSLLRIIANALSATEIEIGFAVQSSLRPEVQSSGTFLNYANVDDRGFADKTAYEVLEEVLMTLNMTICQQDNKWYLVRLNDINAAIYAFDKNLQYTGMEDATVAQIGQMYVNQIYPVGNLLLTKQAAKKGAKFSYTPILPLSIFKNPRMEKDGDWDYDVLYIDQKPGVLSTFNNQTVKSQISAYVINSTLGKNKDYALSQSIAVEKSTNILKLQISYSPLAYWNRGPVHISNLERADVRLIVKIELKSSNGTYYLTQEGWATENAEDIGFTAPAVQDTIAARANKDTYQTATLEFPGLPEDGVLTIAFRNDSRITADEFEREFKAFLRMAVSNIYLTLPSIEGYNSNVIANQSAAQMNEDISFLFSDAFEVANEALLHHSYISYPENIASKWLLAGATYESFYQVMIQDLANSFGSVLNRFSGVISGKNLLNVGYHEKFSNSAMRLISGTYDLLSDELSGEWVEISPNAVDLQEYEVLTNEGQKVNIGSAETNKVPTGNFASIASLEALTKIVNNLDLVIGTDDNGDVYIKKKIIKELDENGEEVERETPRNFYSFGEVSSGGVGSGNSGGGGTEGGIGSILPYNSLANYGGENLSEVFSAYTTKKLYDVLQTKITESDLWTLLSRGGNSGTIDSSLIPDLSGKYVTLDTMQTITGQKTFNKSIYLKENEALYYALSDGNRRLTVYLDTAKNLFFGRDTARNNESTYIAGTPLIFRYGQDKEAMRITSSGNVVIGPTSDNATYKLRVNSDDFIISHFHRNKGAGYGAAILFSNNTNQLGSVGFDYENNFVIRARRDGSNVRDIIIKNGNTIIGDSSSDSGKKLQVNGGISTQSIQIGGATLTWDAENECLVLDKNFAAYGEVSSGGIGEEDTTGGGSVNLLKSWGESYNENYALSAGLGVDLNNRLIVLENDPTLDSTALWAELTKADTSKVIDSSHIPNLYLLKSDYTASDILAKLNTVDGTLSTPRIRTSNICIECTSEGTATRTHEINDYKSILHLQYNSTYGISLCYGGGNVGIGTYPSEYNRLLVNGNIYAIGDYKVKEGQNILLRPNNSSIASGIGVDTNGNECIALWAKNSVTRLRWHAGIDLSSGIKTGSMMGITPDFEISKASGTAKGYIAGVQIVTTAVTDALNENIIATQETLSASIGSVEDRVDSAETTIGALNSSITALGSRVGEFDEDLVLLIDEIGKVSGYFDANGNALNALTATTATKATKLVDANNSSNTIQLSTATPFSTSSPAYLAAWSSNTIVQVSPSDIYVGNATQASKLSVGNKTVWGQTYFSDGIPVSISGNMSDVGDITMTGQINIGNAVIWWDSENNCLRTNANFAADGEVSSGGIGEEEQGGYLSVYGGVINGDLQIGTTSSNETHLYGTLYFHRWRNPETEYIGVYMNRAGGIDVDGNIHCDTLYQSSDIRYKNVIEDILLPNEVIANAPMFRYTWTDRADNRVFIGSSAQYWAEFAQELTMLTDDRYSLDYATLGVLMGKSNATEIEQLKERVRVLEQEVENYRNMLNN